MATATREVKTTGAAATWPEWARYLKARFGLHTAAIDHEAWAMVFADDLREWTGAEIMEAAKWMKSEGQRWKKPESADDMVVAVRTYRKHKRNERYGVAAGQACDKCNGGWLLWTPPEEREDYKCSIPCLCAAGRHIVENCQPYKFYDDRKLAALECEREQARNVA
jgi:hypothetical protein